ncbi:MAG: hypothetical protein ACJAR1_001631 [Rubritalea sp.]|jgi:hypothetical protein
MKRFIIISAIISAFVVLNSCEQHEWKDTKLLHVDKAEKHDTHDDKAHGGHAEKPATEKKSHSHGADAHEH